MEMTAMEMEKESKNGGLDQGGKRKKKRILY